MNINQNISDNPAEKDSAGFYDPSTESFPTSLEGKVLFYIFQNINQMFPEFFGGGNVQSFVG